MQKILCIQRKDRLKNDMGAFKNTKLHTKDCKPVGKITKLKLN